ncbi:MAG: UvrD-helicase domain-containing protein [Alphaproteobacteria bacterium]
MLEVQRKVHCAALTRDLFALGEAVLNLYDSLKAEQGVLDFDDLIFETLDLLKGRSDTAGASGGQWVQYKLDRGLEHILVDEAQDTNPEQWAIVEALCDEFFAGRSAGERERTIFSVGDEKQSIYGFQRASPEEFARMHAYFTTRVTQAGSRWETIKLNISFRSVKSVLAAVDSVFESVSAFGDTGGEPVRHHSFRRGQAGLVELWPVFEDDEASQEDLWTPPLQAQDKVTGTARLAAHIAETVRKWLDDGEMLPSRGRPLRPGDIMVLVRTRTAFTHQLTRALKAQGVPVGGVDRIVLNDQIAVQDMLACASFALLPEDDLTLACLLKSPLIGLSEEALYDLAYGRSGSLWERVKAQAVPAVQDYLAMLIEEGRRSTPYDFLSMILQRPCPAESGSGLRAVKKRLGEDALEVLDELLNSALEFERLHTPLLQPFLQWQKEGGGDIKREDEDGADHVRILTVHGSKGLQAPIVILPDTTSSPGQSRGNRPGERILWPDKTGLDIPLWSPRTECDYATYSRAAEALWAREIAEYDRLLYVAMTRAEDRLYVGGALKSKELQDGCWYERIRTGLERLPDIEQLDGGELRLSNPQLHDPDRPDVKPDTPNIPTTPPAWLGQAAPQEQALQAALAPSRLEDASDSALSPLKGADDFRFRRGNLTHKLLEILPGLPLEARAQATNHFLSRNAPDLDGPLRADIAAETLALLEHPEFAPLFGPESLAEAPVAGFLPDGTPVRGQVDRLLIGPDDIWIIDYKTNRPPPKTPEEVPQIYRAQLKSYAAILSQIYPGRVLHARLLWTDGPCLMPIDLKGV